MKKHTARSERSFTPIAALFAAQSLLSALALTTPPAYAGEGSASGTGRGGHDVEIDFARAAELALDEVESQGPELKIDVRTLRLRWESATVSATADDLTYHGTPKVALTTRETNSIRINIDRWNEIGIQRRKQALALHEILVLCSLENTGSYRISAKAFKLNPEYMDTDSPLVLISLGARFVEENPQPPYPEKNFSFRFEAGSSRDQLILITSKGETVILDQGRKSGTLVIGDGALARFNRPDCQYGMDLFFQVMMDGALLQSATCRYGQESYEAFTIGTSRWLRAEG